MIAFDTTSPEGKQYEDFVKFMKGWFEERGIAAEVVYVDDVYRMKVCPWGPRPILFAWVGEGEPLVEFNGHYDVVPPGQGWKSNPFEAKVKGDKLYGRGASDMKGGLASIALALEKLSGWKGPKVQAVFVPDEEIGGRCGTGYRVYHLKDEFPVGRYVIIAEPSGDSVWIGHKGGIWMEVEVLGEQGHASVPWYGDNAFIKAASLALQLQNELTNMFSKRFSEYEYTSNHPMAKFNTVTIGGIAYSTSNKANVIPGSFKFSIDIRVIPEESAEDVARKVYELIPDYAKAKVTELMEPYVNSNSKLAKLIEKKWGFPSKVCEGGLDLRYYRGYDAVAWGPGELSQAHKPNEWVSLSKVEKYASMYAELAKELVSET